MCTSKRIAGKSIVSAFRMSVAGGPAWPPSRSPGARARDASPKRGLAGSPASFAATAVLLAAGVPRARGPGAPRADLGERLHPPGARLRPLGSAARCGPGLLRSANPALWPAASRCLEQPTRALLVGRAASRLPEKGTNVRGRQRGRQRRCTAYGQLARSTILTRSELRDIARKRPSSLQANLSTRAPDSSGSVRTNCIPGSEKTRGRSSSDCAVYRRVTKALPSSRSATRCEGAAARTAERFGVEQVAAARVEEIDAERLSLRPEHPVRRAPLKIRREILPFAARFGPAHPERSSPRARQAAERSRRARLPASQARPALLPNSHRWSSRLSTQDRRVAPAARRLDGLWNAGPRSREPSAVVPVVLAPQSPQPRRASLVPARPGLDKGGMGSGSLGRRALHRVRASLC